MVATDSQPWGALARSRAEAVISPTCDAKPATQGPCGSSMVTGGVVAHNPIIVELISDALGREVLVPDYPQYTGALGAALIAAEIEQAREN